MEKPTPPDEIIYWPCENGLIVSSPSSITLVLIRVVGKSWPVAWFEYVTVPDKEVFLFQSDLVDRMPMDERQKEMSLEVLSAGGGRVRFNWKTVMTAGRTHVPEQSGEVFRSRMVGGGNTEGSSDSGDVVFKSQLITVGLKNIRTPVALAKSGISHSRAIYSLEFHYTDGSNVMFGTPHPRSKFTDVAIDAANGEVITGFHVRASDWVDAMKVITNKKQSAWLGHLGDAQKYALITPQGYNIIGVYGRYGRCCDAFGIIYTSNT
jgi:hypothetical protein